MAADVTQTAPEPDEEPDPDDELEEDPELDELALGEELPDADELALAEGDELALAEADDDGLADALAGDVFAAGGTVPVVAAADAEWLGAVVVLGLDEPDAPDATAGPQPASAITPRIAADENTRRRGLIRFIDISTPSRTK